MRHATTQATVPFQELVDLAHRLSQSTRQRAAADSFAFSDPTPRWQTLIAARRAHPRLRTAGRGFGKGVNRVRVAVREVVKAIRELAEWTPQFTEFEHVMEAREARRYRMGRGPIAFSTWELTSGSLAHLNELRQRVRIRLIECQEMLDESYPDAWSRFQEIARRVAGVVLSPSDAAMVSEWLGKFAEADAG